LKICENRRIVISSVAESKGAGELGHPPFCGSGGIPRNALVGPRRTGASISATELHPQPNAARLTERQVACLEGVAQHKSAKEIGRELGISNHAVEKHLKVARQKLGATSTVEALRIYRRGTVAPHYASSDLFSHPVADHQGDRGRLNDAALMNAIVRPRRIWEIDYELGVAQTLAAIGICVVALVVVFALIIAIAQGAYLIWPF